MTIFSGYTYDTTHRGLGGMLRLVWFTMLYWLRNSLARRMATRIHTDPDVASLSLAAPRDFRTANGN